MLESNEEEVSRLAFRVVGRGSRPGGLGFGVWGLGFRLGFRVTGSGFRVQVLGFKVYGLWFMVEG